MTAIDVDSLLQEISAGEPSGSNLEYDPEFTSMVSAAQIKPEQQYGDKIIPPEDPDWGEVEQRALALLARSKDLRVAVYLTRALLQREGPAGLARGLEVVLGLLERHWETVHPELDREDDNDPTMRINALVALCDPATMIRGIREMALVQARGFGSFSLRDITALASTGEGEGSERTTTIEAAFQACELTDLQATEENLSRSIESVAGIDTILMERVGPGRAPDLSALSKVLQEAQQLLSTRLAERGVQVPGGEGQPAGQGTSDPVEGGAAGSGPATPGEIRSREDVLRVLDRICDYYKRHEPSSPVPMLLRRARRLVSKSFMEILRDLTPDGVSQAESLQGLDEGR